MYADGVRSRLDDSKTACDTLPKMSTTSRSTRRKIAWCLFCQYPLTESASNHAVTPTHVVHIYRAVLPWGFDYDTPQPCAPADWLVYRQGAVQRAVPPELGSQILHLYVEDLYARHIAMHPYGDFSLSAFETESPFDYNISDDDAVSEVE